MGIDQHAHAVALRRIELHLEDSGIAFTHLRPNFFMQIFAGGPLWVGLRTEGALRIPAGSAKISFIDARDVAGAAAVARKHSRSPLRARQAYPRAARNVWFAFTSWFATE